MKTPSITLSAPVAGRYALRKGAGFWELLFNGQSAVFKHEQGAYYAASLLLNPPAEPIHGLVLALRAEALFHPARTAGEIPDPVTGRAVLPDAGACVRERSLGLDDARAALALRSRRRRLEAALEAPDEPPQMKAEIERELEALEAFQRAHPWRAVDAAQRSAEAVGKALKRLHRHLAEATDAAGRPHPTLRAFAAHLLSHLLHASGRCCALGGPRPGQALAGCFIYRPPQGVRWTT